MIDGYAELSALAHRHLPADVADRWLALARPAARLEPVTDPSQPVAGQLGGDPQLPADTAWPHWPGHGPLTFIAAVDCAALPTAELDIPLPADGSLLFFYFDGQLDDGDALVLPSEADSEPGSRVLYVPAGTATSERAAPDGITPYPRVDLAVRLHVTAADAWHPRVHATFAPDGAPRSGQYDHPVCADDFGEALWDWRGDGDVGHQVGGFATPVQDAVEYEIAQAILGGDADFHSPQMAGEATRWQLLLQIDSDDAADMMWGDCGVLYWLMRREDLPARRFDQAKFTWQCS